MLPGQEPVNERELLLAAQAGDKAAYGQLVQHYYKYVTGIIYRLVRHPGLTEDLVQETFLSGWQSLPRFRPQNDRSLRAWLGRIASNKALDYLRRRKLDSVPVQEELVAQGRLAVPEQAALAGELNRLIAESIATLPERSQAALILREYEGLSYREIAEVLDIPIGTVMSRLSYARKKLREQLEPYLYHEK